jgi:hypothetical protein
MIPVVMPAEDSPLTVAGAAAVLRAPSTRTAFPFDPLREPPSSILKTVPRTVKPRRAEFFRV